MPPGPPGKENIQVIHGHGYTLPRIFCCICKQSITFRHQKYANSIAEVLAGIDQRLRIPNIDILQKKKCNLWQTIWSGHHPGSSFKSKILSAAHRLICSSISSKTSTDLEQVVISIQNYNFKQCTMKRK